MLMNDKLETSAGVMPITPNVSASLSVGTVREHRRLVRDDTGVIVGVQSTYVSRGRSGWAFVPAVTAPEARAIRAIAPPIREADLIQDTITLHGHAWTAARYSKRMCFTHFYYLAFGRLPRV